MRNSSGMMYRDLREEGGEVGFDRAVYVAGLFSRREKMGNYWVGMVCRFPPSTASAVETCRNSCMITAKKLETDFR